MEAWHTFKPCYSDCNQRGLWAWRPAVQNVFPFPTALFPTLLLALNCTDCIHGFSGLWLPGWIWLTRSLGRRLREGRNAVRVFIPLLTCWGHLGLTEGHCFPQSGPFYPTLPLELRYNNSYSRPVRGRVVLQLSALILNSPEALNTRTFVKVHYQALLKLPCFLEGPCAVETTPTSSQFLQQREILLLTWMAPATAGE